MLPNLHTYSNTVSQLFYVFPNSSNFFTLSNTFQKIEPSFFARKQGSPPGRKFPNPHFSPKIHWLFAPNPANKCALSDYAGRQ
jgi:hypothetical protein